MSSAAFGIATTYRPRRFADVAGQRHVRAVLKAVATSDSPAQQILLSGPSGTGKTTMARILAGSLFCEQRQADGEPCGSCHACHLVFTGPGSHPDVLEVDAASYGGVDQIRDLATSATHAPMLASKRVFIIDEAHGLTHGGGQAFLKLLEEPPASAIFILATTDPQKLPLAIRGRCLQLEVMAVTPADLADNIRRVCQSQQWPYTIELADAVIAASDSELGVRGTLMTLAKLGTVLEQQRTPTSQEYRELLAACDAQAIHSAWEVTLSGDLPALTQLNPTLLTDVSPATVRSQLMTAGYERLQAPGATGSELAAVVRVLSALHDSDPTPQALTLALARTCLAQFDSLQATPSHRGLDDAPAVDPAPAQFTAAPHQHETSPLPVNEQGVEPGQELASDSWPVERQDTAPPAQVAHVDTATPDSGAPTAATQDTPPVAATAPHPFDAPAGFRWRNDDSPNQPAAEPQAPGPAPTSGPEDSGPSVQAPVARQQAADLVGLLNAVAAVSAKAALGLRRSSITEEDDGFMIEVGPSVSSEQVAELTTVLAALSAQGWRIFSALLTPDT